MKKVIDKILIRTLILLMSIMVLSTLLQVFARFIDLNVQFTEELTIYAMMWVTFFGSAYAFGLRKHIAIDVLVSSVSIKNKWKVILITEFFISLFAILVLLIGGIRFVFITFKLGQVSAVMQIPKGWIYLAIPLSGILTLIYNFINVQETLKERKAL